MSTWYAITASWACAARENQLKICEQSWNFYFLNYVLPLKFSIVLFAYFRMQETKWAINLLLDCKHNKLEKCVQNQLERRNFQMLKHREKNICWKKRILRKLFSRQKFKKNFPLLHKEKNKEKSRSRKEKRQKGQNNQYLVDPEPLVVNIFLTLDGGLKHV